MNEKDELAKEHLRELDKKHGKNLDDVLPESEKTLTEESEITPTENPRIVKRNGKRILLENNQVDGEDPFDFGNRDYWMEVPLDNLPSKGMFYSKTVNIYIKPAEVAEIKHWSTMDPLSFLDVDSKMNYVLERCLKFTDKESEKIYLWKDVLEVDRLFLIFRISELTFPGDTNKLQMTFSCDRNCKAPIGEQGQYKKKVVIGSKNLNLLKLDEYLLQLYNSEERCFVKHTKKGKDIKLYLPTSGVASKIKNLIVELREKGEPLDPFVVKVLPYYINDYSKIDIFNLKNLAVEIMGWDKNKVLFINGVVDKIEKSTKLSAVHTCTKCSAVLEVPLFFRGEPKIKNLFVVSDELDDLV